MQTRFWPGAILRYIRQSYKRVHPYRNLLSNAGRDRFGLTLTDFNAFVFYSPPLPLRCLVYPPKPSPRFLPPPTLHALRRNSRPEIPPRATHPEATRSATAQLPAANVSSPRCPGLRVEWPLPECGQTPLPQYLSDSAGKDFFVPRRTLVNVRAQFSPPPSIPPRQR